MSKKMCVSFSNESIRKLDAMLITLEEADIEGLSPIVDDVLNAYMKEKVKSVREREKGVNKNTNSECGGYA